jgi:hypothetical protein
VCVCGYVSEAFVLLCLHDSSHNHTHTLARPHIHTPTTTYTHPTTYIHTHDHIHTLTLTRTHTHSQQKRLLLHARAYYLADRKTRERLASTVQRDASDCHATSECSDVQAQVPVVLWVLPYFPQLQVRHVWCSAVQCSVVQYNVVQYSVV